MEYPGRQLLNDIQTAQEETNLLMREMVGKATQDNELFKSIIERLNDISARLKLLEERDSPG
ncbi:MAG: hypothetical protein QOJ86_4343 [Bradyrhizobium sp.]|jgi:hypothetical protein|nr:hypothetical protein [Bradyrhizobium sp.]